MREVIPSPFNREPWGRISKNPLLRTTFSLTGKELLPNKVVEQLIKVEEDYAYRMSEEDFERSLVQSIAAFELRHLYRRRLFPLISHEFLVALSGLCSQFKHVIELSAGTGWLTWWLRKYGTDVKRCVDNKSWQNFHRYHAFVERADSPSVVQESPKADLFIICWPYMDPVAYWVWEAMKFGQYLLYIGEGPGGCTADYAFFGEAEGWEIEDDYDAVNEQFLSFYGVHDRVHLYRKGD